MGPHDVAAYQEGAYPMKKVAIATLGCKTNQFESATISEQFAAAGYQLVPFSEPADICVINSCTVTARTDAETRRLIRRARRLNPDARIVATGCYAQVSPDELARMPEVDVVLGNREKLDHRLLTYATDDLVSDAAGGTQLPPLGLTSFSEHTRAFLQVQNGCNSFCAYCIVPYARGRSRSVDQEQVIAGINNLTENGFNEVVLTGIHLGAYGQDLPVSTSLYGLIMRILAETSVRRLRIGSVEPNEFGSDLIRLCADSERICRHFHIPLQSGSDRVLSSMGRHYDTALFRRLLREINNTMPDAFIGTDIIAGFPGETEGDFLLECELLKDLPLADMHVFPYSRRSGTRAADMPDHLSPSIISARAAGLRGIAARKHSSFLDGFIGKELLVLGQQYNEKQRIVRGISRNYIQAEYAGSPVDLNREKQLIVSAIKNGMAICSPCPA